jgi:plasmid stabilization system protein ParE
MGRVVWTDPAIDDLTGIMDYIARDSPRYALQVGERIYEAAGKLDLGLRAGWKVPEFDVDHFFAKCSCGLIASSMRFAAKAVTLSQ